MGFFKKIKNILTSNEQQNIKSNNEDFFDIPTDPEEFESYMRKRCYPWEEPPVNRYYELLEKSRKLYPDRRIERVYKELVNIYEEMLDIVTENKDMFSLLIKDGIKIYPYKQYHLLCIFYKEYDKAIDICKKAIDYFDEDSVIEYYKKEIDLINRKMNKKDEDNLPITEQSQNLANNNLFDEWNISISFGKSTSTNYNKALFLAKNAPKYDEIGEGRQLTHQAIYTSYESDFNNFVALYEIVKGWKSTFFFLNGKYIDKKDISLLVRCYGDKCRSRNKNFCFGASEYTENPFGCHRLMVHTYNNPWWSFGTFDKKGIWHIDKAAIKQRLEEHTFPYCDICPAFDMDKVYKELENLPDTINPKKEKRFERDGDRLLYLVDAGYWR